MAEKGIYGLSLLVYKFIIKYLEQVRVGRMAMLQVKTITIFLKVTFFNLG